MGGQPDSTGPSVLLVGGTGRTGSVRGVFGPPRDLVAQATERLCASIDVLQPSDPIRFILMSSVSVNDPRGVDTRRGAGQRAALWALRGVVPPARDNQRAADFLRTRVGTMDPFVEWVVVRPDTLREGDISQYALHDGLVSSLFAPDNTAMANVGHFMCELATDQSTWQDWRGKMPVITDAPDSTP